MSVAVHATSREGETRMLSVGSESSVMEVLRDAGFGDVAALCGGSCSCATCHVYLAEDDLALFDPPSEDENDLLDGVEGRQANSRLSCQLKLDGLARAISVTVAPED